LLLPIYGCHDTNVKIKEQIVWGSSIKQKVWTQIVKFKVENQGFMLKFLNIEDDGYFVEKSSSIRLGDEGNIEAQAAKKFFHLLFGNKFVRASDSPTNSALNYGYSLLLSIFNREIVKNGYLTQLGIGHKSVNNHFNLGCDLMEPFRPLIDKIVKESNIQENFGTEEKHQMLQVFESKLVIDGKTFSLLNTIERYTSSVFKALNSSDVSLIKNYRYGKN
jgi:CRISPR-associated endonuclease Cas1 subtype II